MAERKRAVKQRRRERKNVPQGHVHIQATLQQHDRHDHRSTGAVISWGSAGVAGFKGSRKSTPVRRRARRRGAARKRAMEHGMRQVEVYVKGPGAGREQAIRSLQAAGLEVTRDHRRHAHPAQRLPPAQAAPRLSRRAPWPDTPTPSAGSAAARALKLFLKGSRCYTQEVLVRAAPDAARPARRPPPQGRRLRPPAAREAEGPPRLRRARAPVPQLLLEAPSAAPA